MEENQVVDNQIAPEVEGQAEEAPTQAEAGADTATKAPAEKAAAPAQPEFDVQTSYKALLDKYEKLDKSYGEIRGVYTRTTQDNAEMRRQLESITKMLSKATEEPINPERFFKDFQAQGPKALDAYLDKKVESVREDYNKRLIDAETSRVALEATFEEYKRDHDPVNYPDFAKLKPIMQAIAQSDRCPVDLNKPIPEVYDALYKLAKDQLSNDALKQAEQMGRKQAEAELAKESQTTVAGGGKAGGSTNPAEIKDLGQLRQFFVDKYGVAE